MIFLIGMMGSGKTAVGRALAGKLHWRFRDTDAMVVRNAKQSISAIFESQGERKFRRLESQALRNLLGTRRLVVATGGGMVLAASNLAWMRKQGVVIHLSVPLSVLSSRLEKPGKESRPLLRQGMQALRDLARQRRTLYAGAEFKISGLGTPQQVAERVLRMLGKKRPQVLHDKTAR